MSYYLRSLNHKHINGLIFRRQCPLCVLMHSVITAMHRTWRSDGKPMLYNMRMSENLTNLSALLPALLIFFHCRSNETLFILGSGHFFLSHPFIRS